MERALILSGSRMQSCIARNNYNSYGSITLINSYVHDVAVKVGRLNVIVLVSKDVNLEATKHLFLQYG